MSDNGPSQTQRPYPPVLLAMVGLLLVLLAIASFGGYRDLESARQRKELLETRIEATRQRNEELTQRIRRLQEDPAAIERLAREQYRMMRPGDVIVVLPEEPAGPTPKQDPPSNDPL